MLLKSNNGYNISYEEYIPVNPKGIIVAMHGFAGDKESGCITLLQNKALELGFGLVKFDWPAHGSSDATDDKLTIKNCLSDLNTVINKLKNDYKNVDLFAFSTSFGGYLTLLYNYNNKVFKHIILRSPAINMYNVLKTHILTDEIKEQLNKYGCFDYGFERVISIKKDFVEDLKNNNVMSLYQNKELSNISIIHGTADDLVPFEDSKEFCEVHGCTLYPVEGADHRYKKTGELDKVINITKDILLNNFS